MACGRCSYLGVRVSADTSHVGAEPNVAVDVMPHIASCRRILLAKRHHSSKDTLAPPIRLARSRMASAS